MTKIKNTSSHSVNNDRDREFSKQQKRSIKLSSPASLSQEQSIKGERQTQAMYLKNKLLNIKPGQVYSAQGAAAGKRDPPPDTVYDGLYVGASGKTYPSKTPLTGIPPVKPQIGANGLTRDGVKPNNETLVYVNGIDTDLAYQTGDLQNIADRTGSRVIGIHNSTDDSQGDIPGIGVPMADVNQAVNDSFDTGNNPAVTTLVKTIQSEIKAGRSIHLIGESQGAIIVSRALKEVKSNLEAEYNRGYTDGTRRKPFPKSDNWQNARYEAEIALSRVKVETFGGAAGTYPDGPEYVHYVNRLDPVAARLGPKSSTAGRGAVIREFDYGTGGFDSHILRQAYLPQRVPFDQARKNAASNLPPDPPVRSQPAPTPDLSKPAPPTESPTSTAPTQPPVPGTSPI